MPFKVAIKYTNMCHKQGVSSDEQSSRSKFYWSDYSFDEIYNKYVQCLSLDLEKLSDRPLLMLIKSLITNSSSQLLCPKKKKQGKSVLVKLPVKVKTARSLSDATFESWMQNSFTNEGDIHDEYWESPKAYR